MTAKALVTKVPVVLKIAYLIGLITAVLYVKSVLDVDSFRAAEKGAEKSVEKVNDISVTLVVTGVGLPASYSVVMQSNDTVKDLLAELRKKRTLEYETDLYSYGTEIISVNGIDPGNEKKWAVLINGDDVTEQMSDTRLEENGEYRLQQVTIHNEGQ